VGIAGVSIPEQRSIPQWPSPRSPSPPSSAPTPSSPSPLQASSTASLDAIQLHVAGTPLSLHQAGYQYLFAPWFPPRIGSLAYALAIVALNAALLYRSTANTSSCASESPASDPIHALATD